MSTNRWFVVTNTENLEYFFHCGLIVDKQGFSGNAYISDIMKDRPVGYIPCFPQTNLWNALEAAKSEDENLSECLIEIDINQIDCPSAFFRTENLAVGKYKSFQIEKKINETTQALSEVLLPAPLPLSCVKKIILKDDKGARALNDTYECAFSSNKKIITLATKNDKKTFFKKHQFKQTDNNLDLENPENDQDNQPPSGEQVQPRQLDYQQTFSFGGALSLLYYQTKNGRQSTQIFDDFTSHSSENSSLRNIAPLKSIFFKSENDLNEYAKLYNQLINCISKNNNIGEARYNVLQILNNQDALPPKYSNDCAGLANSLTKLIERTHPDDSDTIFTKLIEHYEAKEIGRSKFFLLLTMFFVRDDSETMLKYYHSEFTQEDYALLAIFFGAINGFIKTPNVVRGIHGLSMWVSSKMANYMHKKMIDTPSQFSETSPPLMIHTKYFKPKTDYLKTKKLYDYFWRTLKISPDDLLSVTITYSDEAILRGKSITTGPDVKVVAELNLDQLEKVIQHQTIDNSNELFDFNIIIDADKKILP